MPHRGFAAIARKERRVGDRLPYLGHVDDRTIALKGGALMQTILLDGFPFETADTEELNYRQAVRDSMLRGVGDSRIALYHHIVRRRASADLGGSFPDPFCAHLDRRWRARLSAANLFVNDLFLSIILRPAAGRGGFAGLALKGARAATRSGAAERAAALRKIDGVREGLLAALRAYGPRALERYGEGGERRSEPLEFLSLLLNGELRPALEPSGEAAQHLAYKRVSFGADAVEVRGAGAGATSFGAMISLKEYPFASTPGAIDGLMRLPAEMVVTESFAFVERQTAKERIDLALRRRRAADDETTTLRRGLAAAKDDAASGQAAFGEHHLSVFVTARDLEALDRTAAAAQAAIGDIGAVAVREDLNLEAAYWAQFPGNFEFIGRRALISTGNFSGLSSLHGFPTGRPDGNHWGPAIAAFETTSATPYFFNFHHGDLGNFVVIGPSGSGKTVVLNFLLAQAQKLAPRTVFFDKDRGAEIFLRAIGGGYETLKIGKPTGFNPLQLDDTPGNRAFLRIFLAELLTSAGGPLSPEEQAAVGEAVAANYEQPRDYRRLRFLQELLGGFDRPRAGDLAARIARWCGEGEHAWLFDNEEDGLGVDRRVVGFDMTELLDAPEIRTPAMMYLFRRIEERLDGSPTIIVIDEGWKALNDDAFAARLRDWLKTIRKRNGVVGFCTQSAADALDSRIASAITEQTAVRLFLPNSRARAEDYCQGFGLTGHELEIIRSLPDHSRCFLVKAGTDSVVLRLDLSGMPEVLRILSGREQTVRALDLIRERVGDAPENWLPLLLRGGRPPAAKAIAAPRQLRLVSGSGR
jgi:type IV secretion system protein VirB4